MGWRDRRRRDENGAHTAEYIERESARLQGQLDLLLQRLKSELSELEELYHLKKEGD